MATEETGSVTERVDIDAPVVVVHGDIHNSVIVEGDVTAPIVIDNSRRR